MPYGFNGQEVEAFANADYEFDKWSDGVTTAKRQDTNISENITVTAIFKEKSAPPYIPQPFVLGKSILGSGDYYV